MSDMVYILSSGASDGPFKLPEIVSFLESGRYKLDTYGYCKVASRKWETLETILLFFYSDIEWDTEEDNSSESFTSSSLEIAPETFPLKRVENLPYDNIGGRPTEVQSLDSMLAHSKEFHELTENLSVFNLWKVLNIRNRELYHEKALTWMFDQKGSHGLGSAFLRNWLIDVLEHNQNSKYVVKTDSLGPINLDYAVFKSVVETQRAIQVDGQPKRLDLLFIIESMKQGKWAIMVELKVRHVVSDTQLSSYRNWMEEVFPDHQRLLVLLYDQSQDGNEPRNWPQQKEREFWIPATFSKLKNCIRETLSSNQSRIPSRETSFIEQYLENLPPLAPDINLDKVESLTHRIFGRFYSGIQYAITAKDTSKRNREYWQTQVVHFMGNYPYEFRLLGECTEWKFLKKELIHRLEHSDWFPKLEDYNDFFDQGVDYCIIFQESENLPKPEDEHLNVRFQLYYGSKDNLPCLRLRIRVEKNPNFFEERQNLIQDFFGQVHPYEPNYGGRDMVHRETGLIYNKALQSGSYSDLFQQVDALMSSFRAIWHSEQFLAARKAIFAQVSYLNS